MSNWLGTGAPNVIVGDTTTSLGRPIKDGRVEEWVIEKNEMFTSVNGERIYGERKFRFRAEYKFANLTDALLRQLLDWYNARQVVLLEPYNGVPSYRQLSRIEELRLVKGSTPWVQDLVEVTFEGTTLRDQVPIPDTRRTGKLLTRVGQS